MLCRSILQHSGRCCQVHLSDDILVPPGSVDSNNDIDKLVHKTTAGISHTIDVHKIFKRQYLYELFMEFISGGLPEALIILLIPLYLCVFRPFIRRYIPGMLKRIGLGMIIRLLSLQSFFVIEAIGHIHDSTNNKCFLHLFMNI